MKNPFKSPEKEEKVMKKKTFYHLVLDKSGSMETCWAEARQVINQQLLDLQRIQAENVNNEILFSFCVFNQSVRFSQGLMNVDDAKIEWGCIFPEGMTALYDGVGESIEFIKGKANEELAEQGSDVVMLIMTDGHENASKKYSGIEIKEMIQTYEHTEKWNFLFLGAGLNVNEATRELDRDGRNSFSFRKDNFQRTFAMVTDEIGDFVKSKSTEEKKRSFFDRQEDF